MALTSDQQSDFLSSVAPPLLTRGGALYRGNAKAQFHSPGAARCRLYPRSSTSGSYQSASSMPAQAEAASRFQQLGSAATALANWYEGVVKNMESSTFVAKSERRGARGRLDSGINALVGIPSAGCLFRQRACARLPSAGIIAKKHADSDGTGAGRRDESTESNASGCLRPTHYAAAEQASGLYSTVAQLAARCQSSDIWTHVIGVTTSALAPVAIPGGGSLFDSGAVAAAFCPMPLAFPDLGHCVPVPKIPEFSMQELERGVFVATFIQGSLGLVRIFSGDLFSGSYTLLLATLGYNARHPGPASNWLKTYVLITFINGTMSCIDLAQQSLNQNFPVLLPSLPLSVNLAHLSTLLIPGVSYLGAYCGWQHIKMQRKVQLDQYTQQIEHMLQNPPWPPPPLPAQIVHSMVQYSLQHAQLEDASLVEAKTGGGSSSSSSSSSATGRQINAPSGSRSERLPRVDEADVEDE
jgi:hypothetical protein